MQTYELAVRHQELRSSLTDSATAAALRLFRSMNVQYLDQSWDAIAPALTLLVTNAQLAAARQSTSYVAGVAATYGVTETAPKLVVEAFGGVANDGREIGPAMFSSVTRTKALIGRGVAAERAFETGAFYLAMMVGTLVQDAGRSADMVAATSRKFTHYVRVVSPGACSRCAILAGKASYKTAFQRHPKCRCIAEPIAGDTVPASMRGRFESPHEYFDSLSKAEQDRRFTKAGAEAIRRGADPVKVVNARRGYFGTATPGAEPRRLRPVTIGVRPDGSPLQVFATAEGTTYRGSFSRLDRALTGRRSTSVRLMPEQIIKMAGDDPERWIELLRRYGYLY